ncbi:MAG TPA: DNA gyrase subunit A [Clostridiales bacterium]|jgi:DNA gyrase subunit A|nr:DNA gyrase subunit A [Clostridiales bacterium]
MDNNLTNYDKVIPINIEKEMKKSYLDYAMTVIVSRALPDVRDGLKPVHRRILYAMSELGVTPDKPHRKSARIVGDVLGKYHPHGDTAVYDAMVRLAQDFSTRYPLVDGHGNFGSVDGDSAAAMRYTEARMSKITMEMLRDITKETVNFRFNFDESLKEPVVLPSRYPNLLVNGSNGIAVGMASSIPPHNLGEVIDCTIGYIDNPEITIDEMLKYVKGPDFPTGAEIIGKDNIRSAYRTGRGKVRVRAVSKIEEMKNGKTRILISEIPYQVNKARLIEKIAELVRDKKIDGITDLRDESDRTGMRIVIEIKKDYNPNILLNNLYKHTQLQDTFSIIMIALVDNEPKVLNLKEMIHYYVMHQKEVITRRTQYDLSKAEARAHILEGLKIALDNIDEIIDIIRASYNDAEIKLMDRFNLSEVQARAIVDMRLRRLQGLEREKLDIEYAELLQMINRYKEILANEKLLMHIIKEELSEIKDKYNNKRRTVIKADEDEINIEDLIEVEEVAITITKHGYVKRLPEDTYRIQKRGGKGIIGLSTREGDYVKDIVITSTHDYLYFFTNRGKVYKIKAYEIPEAKRQAKGTAIINLLPIEAGEKVTKVISVKDDKNTDDELIFCTKLGKIKKTKISEFDNIRKSGIIAIKLVDGDELIGVSQIIGEEEDIFIVSQKGKAIRFNEDEVRSMGRTATGVRAISLNKDDSIVSMSIITEEKEIFILSELGYGKMTKTNLYRAQSRAGKGVKTYKITKKTGDIVGAQILEKEDEVMIISKDGAIIRMSATEISTMGRATQGVRIMKLNDGDRVVSLAKIVMEEE